MSRYLEKHLYPKGRSTTEPDLMPNVLDSDSNPISFLDPKRKTNESTVVNLGSSPNSNDGDPLRTAFAKLNNFIEASYWTNESLNQEIEAMLINIQENADNIAIFGGGLDSDVNYLKNVTIPLLIADLDSDSLVLQSLQAQVDLLSSNADSDVVEIARLRREADSDSAAIQSISVYAKTIRNDLDSDFSSFNTKIVAINNDLDSDVNALSTILQSVSGGADSDISVLQTTILDHDSDIIVLKTVMDGGSY